MFPAPSPDERALLKAEHAHRFPELATLSLTGDGGAPVSLPIVLGNPSGACQMPVGAPVSPAWSTLVRASLGIADEVGDVAAQLATDCVLWPDRATWARHTTRWPALPQSVADEIRNKVATRM